jgi:hypothetical protein
MKTGPDALGTAKNEYWEAKQDPTPSEPPKTSPGAQNMETGHDAHGNAENKSGRAKNENGTRHPWNRRK